MQRTDAEDLYRPTMSCRPLLSFCLHVVRSRDISTIYIVMATVVETSQPLKMSCRIHEV